MRGRRPASADADDRPGSTWWRRERRIGLQVDLLGLAAGALVLPHEPSSSLPVLAAAGWLLLLPRPLTILPGAFSGAVALIGRMSAVLLAVATFVDRDVLTRWPVVVGCVLAGRALLRMAVRRLRVAGVVRERVLVVGGDDTSRAFARLATDLPDLGLDPIVAPRAGDTSAHGLLAAARAARAQRVVVSSASLPTDAIADLHSGWDERTAALHVLSAAPGLRGAPGVENVWGIAVHERPLRCDELPTWRVKRMLDVAVACVALLLVGPVLVGITLVLLASQGRPLLFRQTRVGRHGLPFTIAKFRSMRVDHRADVAWNAAYDARPTRFGAILRKTSLDELPQLVNVLRGDMSLVGPRPEIVGFVRRFEHEVPGYERRHRVPVGITGLAQVAGLRGPTSITARARMDNLYVDSWTLRGDFVILARTVLAVLVPRRANVPVDTEDEVSFPGLVIDLRERVRTETPAEATL